MTTTQPGPAEASLAPTLDGAVAHLGTLLPQPTLDVLGNEQRTLAATDDATGRIAVGDVLPATTLPDATGAPVPVGEGATVLVFYRGAWCPFCNLALAAYQREVLPVARGLGVGFVAVSPQGPDGSAEIARVNELDFPVLTDAGGDYGRSLGLSFDLTDDVREVQLGLGNDFAGINAGGEWSLPKPTVIVTDAGGRVRFVDVRPDYTTRTEPADIVAVLHALA